MTPTLLRQRGIALPVMLLIMLMMLMTSVFLLKSINSTTLMSGNVAYESALGKAADVDAIEGGALNPNVAFMQGRIKNTGDMDVLLELFAQIHS